MTITYTLKVSNSRLCGFSKLLFYWKGSVYKLVYKEMLIFLSIYYTLSITYRCALKEDQKRVFEKIVVYFESFLDLIPLTFVLGFYVAIVVGRWWNQYLSIPWPDRLMGYVGTLVHGTDERGRLIRRTLMRWLNLSHILVMQSISICVKKRFPTSQHLVDAGLMTSHEKRKLKDMPTQHNKFWVPTMWFSTLISQCMEEGRIRDEIHLKTFLDEVASFKASLGMLYSYDWISIPLVYTQVTTMAVYGFFFACLMGRQYIENAPEGYTPRRTDLYVPLFTLMQFFFYMGWLKVAEVLINPFGEDEDDFETNWIIDRNYQIAMLGVDEMYCDLPILEKDMYWDDLEPELPYTKSTICHKNEPFMGSTADFSLDPGDVGSQMVNTMETIPENVKVDNKFLYLPTSVTASAVSSPARMRHFITNITSAFSNESIADSQHKDLHINSLHNIKDGIRDPMFFQSPLLQRVKSNSVKRSLSHTEHLNPSKRGGSMSHVNMTSGNDSQSFLSPAVRVTAGETSRSQGARPAVANMNLMTGDFYPRGQTNHGSISSLCHNPRDSSSVIQPCPTSSTPAENPCSTPVEYTQPHDHLIPHVHGTDSRPSSTYQHYNLDQAKPETAVTITPITDTQPAYFPHPPDPPSYASCTVGLGAQQTTPFYTNYASNMPVNTQPQSLHAQANGPRIQTDTLAVPSPASEGLTLSEQPQPTPMYPSFNPLQPAQCNSVWSQNGGNLASTSVPIPSATVFPACDSAGLPTSDQADSKNVHWADDTICRTESLGDDLPVGSEASSTIPKDTGAKLCEAKADSQDSIDSTYDSNYDTVNSQHPLLKPGH